MTKQPGMEDQAEGTTQTSKVPRLQEQQAMQEQQAVIHELPPACVAAIYQFMQPRDIMCCEAVAVSWREAGQVPWRPCDPEWMEDVPAWVAARWSTSLRLMCKVKVDASQYTDEQISGLAHLSELRTLEIDGRGRSPITSAGIQRLVEACPNISELALFILPLVGNSCIPAIGRLQQLGKLRMDFTDVNKGGLAVDNRSLKAMGKCTSLWSLIIVDIIVDFGGWNHWDSTCRVKVETFEIIADNFPNLRALSLRRKTEDARPRAVGRGRLRAEAHSRELPRPVVRRTLLLSPREPRWASAPGSAALPEYPGHTQVEGVPAVPTLARQLPGHAGGPPRQGQRNRGERV